MNKDLLNGSRGIECDDKRLPIFGVDVSELPEPRAHTGAVVQPEDMGRWPGRGLRYNQLNALGKVEIVEGNSNPLCRMVLGTPDRFRIAIDGILD